MEESKDELDKQKPEEIEELKAIEVDSKVELIEEKKQDELDKKSQAIFIKI